MTTSATDSDFANQVASHREYLLRFARLQLRNDTWAEDVVSETIIAALSKPNAFEHRSQLKTWLVGILKFKVIDHFRANAKEVSVDALAESHEDSDGNDMLDALGFIPNGHFAARPADWGDPDQDLSNKQFMAILEACTSKLPNNLGRVFLMREWLELSADEVCKELNITSTNLYVQLHRARLKLRECLEKNWFAANRTAT